MLRTIALLLLLVGTSATDGSAHARLSEIGKGLSSALSRIEPADDISNSGRSPLQLDGSFCDYMETQLSCLAVSSANCASTTGCTFESGECLAYYEFGSLLEDPNLLEINQMGISCGAKSANQCSADNTCDFDGGCYLDGAYFVFWTLDKCPTTTMETAIVKYLVAEGITQAQMQEEANSHGYTITPEMQAEMDAQGMASSAHAAAPVMIIISTIVASLVIFA